MCAKPEVQAIGVHRIMGCSTMLILDSLPHSVATTGGLQDSKEYGDRVLHHWLDLHNHHANHG